MKKHIKCLAFEPRYVELEKVNKEYIKFKKKYRRIYEYKVFSILWNEVGFIFTTEMISEEDALLFFEKERKEHYEEIGIDI